MSNTPDTIANIPNTLTNNYSGYFLEKSISEIVLNFIKGRDNKTFTGIFFAVGVLIGADIIKTLALDLVREQKKQISDEIIGITKYLNIFIPIKYSFGLVSRGFNGLSCKFNSLFKKKFVPIEEMPIDEYVYSLESSNLFLSNLMKYIENEKNLCEFEKKEDTKLTITKNKISNAIVYSNISIPYDGSIIKINSEIAVDNDTVSCTNSSNDIFDELMEKYVKLIDDDEINKIMISLNCSSQKMNVFIDDYRMYCINNIEQCNNIIISYPHMIIFTLCLKKYEKKLIDSARKSIGNYMKKIIFVAWVITCFISFSEMLSIKDIQKILFDVYNKKIDDGVLKNNRLSTTNSMENIKLKNETSLCEYIRNDMLENKNYIVEKAQNLCKKKETETNVDIKLTIKPNNSMETVKKFISYINNLSLVSDNKNKIKIYMAKIKTKLVKTTKQNPKYEKYFEEKKKLLDGDKNCSNEKILQLLGIEPEKELEEDVIEKEVETTYTNEKYTNFLNLYLSDSQDEKLKNLLNSFNADKERLEELGIPNKLCLLLYGEPGTGKTTTIITTASYFGRDIFYVSLKNISNNDLKMIFDYVNEKHSNQGIIVLEDFDAMTNIVSKRTDDYGDNNQEDLTTLLDNLDSGLTLDFFLNVLDGTLTSNNSIVIMTTNHLDKIDPAIYRAGRVDSLIEMKKSDHTQIKKMFKRFILRDIDDKIISQIEEFKYEPAKIIFRLKEFIKKTDSADEEIMSPFITDENI